MAADSEHTPDGPRWETDAQKDWYIWLSGDLSLLPTAQLRTQLAMGRLFKLLPTDPRCNSCGAPFAGIGKFVAAPLGFTRSNYTPHFCNVCFGPVLKQQIGVEVELSMLFADVRGSTPLAESMSPSSFQQIINRFYTAASEVLIDSFALLERLIGDEVVAYFTPGLTGPNHARKAIEAARKLLEVTGHADPDGPWIPVGAGVHTGTAYVGAVGSHDLVTGITALGDDVNTAARLASQAAQGEIVISTSSARAAGLDTTGLESRILDLKGKSEPFPVHVMSAGFSA